MARNTKLPSVRWRIANALEAIPKDQVLSLLGKNSASGFSERTYRGWRSLKHAPDDKYLRTLKSKYFSHIDIINLGSPLDRFLAALDLVYIVVDDKYKVNEYRQLWIKEVFLSVTESYQELISDDWQLSEKDYSQLLCVLLSLAIEDEGNDEVIFDILSISLIYNLVSSVQFANKKKQLKLDEEEFCKRKKYVRKALLNSSDTDGFIHQVNAIKGKLSPSVSDMKVVRSHYWFSQIENRNEFSYTGKNDDWVTLNFKLSDLIINHLKEDIVNSSQASKSINYNHFHLFLEQAVNNKGNFYLGGSYNNEIFSNNQISIFLNSLRDKLRSVSTQYRKIIKLSQLAILEHVYDGDELIIDGDFEEHESRLSQWNQILKTKQHNIEDVETDLDLEDALHCNYEFVIQESSTGRYIDRSIYVAPLLEIPLFGTKLNVLNIMTKGKLIEPIKNQTDYFVRPNKYLVEEIPRVGWGIPASDPCVRLASEMVLNHYLYIRSHKYFDVLEDHNEKLQKEIQSLRKSYALKVCDEDKRFYIDALSRRLAECMPNTDFSLSTYKIDKLINSLELSSTAS